MKKTFNVYNLLGFALLAFALFSCDPCRKVECMNGGNCVEGDCVCQAGYEGSDCASLTSTALAGNYTVVEACDGGSADNYSCNIAVSSNLETQITFDNFYNLEGAYATSTLITADITGPDSFEIPEQTRNGSNLDEFIFSGTGIIADNGDLSLTFEVSVNGNTDNCTATFSRN